MNIVLDSWIIQDGNYDDFRIGDKYKFALELDAKYGEGTAKYLEGLARTTIKLSRIDYEENISYYKTAVDKLKKEKGIE